MSNGTEPFFNDVIPKQEFRTPRVLVQDRGPKVDTTIFPMEDCTGTAKQTVEIVSFGDPVAKPGPYVPVVYEEAGEARCDKGDPAIPREFERDLKNLLNKHSMENDSNTPDFILAKYLSGCLEVFNTTIHARELWYGRKVF